LRTLAHLGTHRFARTHRAVARPEPPPRVSR
jgi:hypothetical protein